MIVDLFAGPGGWDEGLRLIGRDDVIGIEWDADACATARAAGHERLQADVSQLDPMLITGWDSACEGLIASPPCQSWSVAGDRKGAQDRIQCLKLADRMAQGDDTPGAGWNDPRSALVCEPVRWVRELSPEWVALEEVPAVAPLWEYFAGIFQGWGYSTWTGDLDAQDFGVPQRRVRRFLIAHRGPIATAPVATTAGSPITMAAALGWGMTEKPYPTIACSRSTGGPDKEKVGGSGARKSIYAERDSGRWIDAAASEQMTFGEMPADTSIRLPLSDAALLQGFPPDYPWQGNASKRAQQIGNAVPPPLAAAVLRHILATITEQAAA